MIRLVPTRFPSNQLKQSRRLRAGAGLSIEWPKSLESEISTIWTPGLRSSPTRHSGNPGEFRAVPSRRPIFVSALRPYPVKHRTRKKPSVFFSEGFASRRGFILCERSTRPQNLYTNENGYQIWIGGARCRNVFRDWLDGQCRHARRHLRFYETWPSGSRSLLQEQGDTATSNDCSE